MTEEFPRWLPVLFEAAGRIAPGLTGRAAARLLTRPGGRNPPQPWESEPAGISPRQVELTGGLRALAWGGPGPVVLAQHGWRGRPTQFGRLAAALVGRGLQVVAIDGPGHGGSPGRTTTPRALADALCAAAVELGEVEALVGHSLGAAAAAVALELGLRARRIAVIAAPARASRMIGGFADRLRLPAPARAQLVRWFDRHAGRPAAELDLVAIRFDAGVEALVVHDLQDDVIPVAEAQLLEAAWPQARFLYTWGLGHRDLLADAGAVGRIAAFLAGGQLPGVTTQPAAGDRSGPAAQAAGAAGAG